MNEENFIKIFSMLCEAYGQQYSKARAMIYFEQLRNFKESEIKRAVGKIIRSSRFMPTVSEVIGMINPVEVGQAWQRCLEVASRGCKGWENLTDVEIMALAEIGGIREIQNTDEEGLHFIFNNFSKVYPDMVKRGIKLEGDNDRRLRILNPHRETLNLLLGRQPTIENKDQGLVAIGAEIKKLSKGQ